MFRILSLLLVTTISTFGTSLIAQAQTTTWKGTLDARGTELRLEIDITKKDGSYSGVLRSLDQNNATIDLADIKSTDKSLSFSVPQIGASFQGKLNSDLPSAKGTFSQGGVELPLTLTRANAGSGDETEVEAPAEKLKEAWVGKLKIAGMEPVMQFRIVTLADDSTKAYFDSITEGQTGFNATWSIEGDQIKFDVERIRLTYRGTLNDEGDTAEGTWSQGGRELPLTIKRQLEEYDSVNIWENRPQRPQGPFPYDQTEVTFKNSVDSVTLAGTLTIPKKAGKHPVVVLISGSGPQDRDESLMEHKPFLVLADYLSRRGIAVLRYDDRGTEKSTGNFGTATTADFAKDASAAVEFLKTHERINPDEIGLAGHSEGGLIAPMVVEMRDDVAFVALLAATGVDGKAISISQGEAMMRTAGMDEEELQLELALSRAVIDVINQANDDADLTDAIEDAVEQVLRTLPESDQEAKLKEIMPLIKGRAKSLQTNWTRFFLRYDPRPALRKMTCPTLAIIGSKDLQVLPDLNMPEIEKALHEAGNKDFEMIELEGLNHLFQKCETGSMAEYSTIQETFNPVALEKIADWIIAHSTPVK